MMAPDCCFCWSIARAWATPGGGAGGNVSCGQMDEVGQVFVNLSWLGAHFALCACPESLAIDGDIREPGRNREG